MTPMQLALAEAWDAFRNGSMPIGAVVTDATGVVVARGRNRMGEATGPEGRLRSTAIAHAEMDCLAQLPMGDYSGHTLFTTLEPCLLCRSATTMAGVGTVKFLAADALCEGLDAIGAINAHTRRRYPTMRGPHAGSVADFASAMPMAVLLLFSGEGDAADDYRRYGGRVWRIAEHIVREAAWPSRSLDLSGAVAHVAEVAGRVDALGAPS